jgi:hypothetical protein
MTEPTRFRYYIDVIVNPGFDPGEVSGELNLKVIDLIQDTPGLSLGGESGTESI